MKPVLKPVFNSPAVSEAANASKTFWHQPKSSIAFIFLQFALLVLVVLAVVVCAVALARRFRGGEKRPPSGGSNRPLPSLADSNVRRERGTHAGYEEQRAERLRNEASRLAQRNRESQGRQAGAGDTLALNHRLLPADTQLAAEALRRQRAEAEVEAFRRQTAQNTNR